MTTAPQPSRRERQHAATVEEIKEIARRAVAEHGGAALNLRAVAREMGMTPSALYRYFASRDALLCALIHDSYDHVGSVAEQAAAGIAPGTDPVDAFMLVACAFRDWALARPHEFGLLFGTPVPGYAPPDTEEHLGHELRVSNVLLRLLHEALDHELLAVDLRDEDLDPRLRAQLEALCGQEFAGLTPAAAALALGCWTSLLGALSAEVFGHLPPQVGPGAQALFELTMRRHLAAMGFYPRS